MHTCPAQPVALRDDPPASVADSPHRAQLDARPSVVTPISGPRGWPHTHGTAASQGPSLSVAPQMGMPGQTWSMGPNGHDSGTPSFCPSHGSGGNSGAGLGQEGGGCGWHRNPVGAPGDINLSPRGPQQRPESPQQPLRVCQAALGSSWCPKKQLLQSLYPHPLGRGTCLSLGLA